MLGQPKDELLLCFSLKNDVLGRKGFDSEATVINDPESGKVVTDPSDINRDGPIHPEPILTDTDFNRF